MITSAFFRDGDWSFDMCFKVCSIAGDYVDEDRLCFKIPSQI